MMAANFPPKHVVVNVTSKLFYRHLWRCINRKSI